jgi:tryptophanyl-tRNA synthetase
VVAALKQGAAFEMKATALWLEGAQVAALADGVDESDLRAALGAFAD